MKRVLVLTLASLACGETQGPARDAAVERPIEDSAQRPSDGPPPLLVDFSVEGCPSFDAEHLSCVGAVPLMLRFVPLVTTPVTRYDWYFGDATLTSYDTGPTPSHVYTLPGQYTVNLVVTSAEGALVSKTHTAFVTATPRALGDSCDFDGQCVDKLFCACPASSPCDNGPEHGMCTALCQTGVCGDGQVCASLLTTPSIPAREPWETSLCLPSCDSDADCGDALRCRTLPVAGAWGQACFSDVPADVGASCLDAKGALRDDLCLGGTCAKLGAKGLCTAACTDQACPPGSDCAMLGDGRALCLRPCTGVADCAPDLLVDCVGPGIGALGYQLVDPTAPDAAATHCAPKECATDDDCLPSGVCQGEGTAGHCVLRTD